MFQDFAALSFCHGIFQKMLWLASYFWFGTLPSWVNSIPESSFGTIGDLKKMSFDIQNMVARIFDPICRGSRIFGQLSLEQIGGIPPQVGP